MPEELAGLDATKGKDKAMKTRGYAMSSSMKDERPEVRREGHLQSSIFDLPWRSVAGRRLPVLGLLLLVSALGPLASALRAQTQNEQQLLNRVLDPANGALKVTIVGGTPGGQRNTNYTESQVFNLVLDANNDALKMICVSGCASGAMQAGAPSGLTVTPKGSAGSRTWTYVVVGRQSSNASAPHTPGSAAASTATGNTTLSASNYNQLAGYQTFAIACYDVYRAASGGTPATTGLIASCVGSTYKDTGAAGDGSSPPTTDTTSLTASPWSPTNQPIAAGMPAGVDLPQDPPKALDDLFKESSLSGQWTWANQGTSTVALSNGSLLLTPQDANAAFSLHYLYQPAPVAPWTVTAKLAVIDTGSTSNGGSRSGGLAISDGTKIIAFGPLIGNNSDGHINILVQKYANPTTWSSDALIQPVVTGATSLQAFVSSDVTGLKYWRIQDDGTNLKFSISYDNVQWTQVYTEARGAFLSTGPTQVGIFSQATYLVANIVGRFDWFQQTQ